MEFVALTMLPMCSSMSRDTRCGARNGRWQVRHVLRVEPGALISVLADQGLSNVVAALDRHRAAPGCESSGWTGMSFVSRPADPPRHLTGRAGAVARPATRRKSQYRSAFTDGQP